MKTSDRNIVLLLGSELRHKYTAAKLLESGLPIKAICYCDQKRGGLPIDYLFKSIKKKGFFKTFFQILGRIYYLLLNRKKDREVFNALYDAQYIESILSNSDVSIHHTDSYANSNTFQWLRNQNVDVFLVHTPYWIASKVLDLSKYGAIGGHPGITPFYRGAYSAFWALYNDKPEDVGCSIFWLNSGVDTGDIIAQSVIEQDSTDSFVTLGWKGMIKQADMMIEVLERSDDLDSIPRQEVTSVPPNSYYDIPTIQEIIRYNRKQNLIR